MLRRYLGIAVGKAFEACLVDEGTGKIAGRPFKGAAGAVHFQWLLAAPPVHEVVHHGLDFFFVAVLELEFYFNDVFLQLLESALAVAKAEFRRFIRADAAAAVDRTDARNDMAHFAAVGSGIHEDGTA